MHLCVCFLIIIPQSTLLLIPEMHDLYEWVTVKGNEQAFYLQVRKIQVQYNCYSENRDMINQTQISDLYWMSSLVCVHASSLVTLTATNVAYFPPNNYIK